MSDFKPFTATTTPPRPVPDADPTLKEATVPKHATPSTPTSLPDPTGSTSGPGNPFAGTKDGF